MTPNKTYQSTELVKILSDQIHQEALNTYCFMEVCGGHTHSIRRYGIPDLIPETIKLVSGPGCPVCVSNYNYIDQSIKLSAYPEVILCSFGDLIRIPGSNSNLEKEITKGRDIRIVLSSIEALEVADKNPDKEVVFLGIGFETTAPSTAAAILEARNRNLNNFSVYSAHKVMPPAMKALTSSSFKLDGFICPGHVSTIAGSDLYRFLPENHSLACVVSGFEPVDLMQSILLLVRQVNSEKPKVEIQYKRAVKPEGNKKALQIMWKVFDLRDDWWRGLGDIPSSGLGISDEFSQFDTFNKFRIEETTTLEPKGCSCGDILRGEKNPEDCILFSKACTPDTPVGACMVSPEGACNASHRYRK